MLACYLCFGNLQCMQLLVVCPPDLMGPVYIQQKWRGVAEDVVVCSFIFLQMSALQKALDQPSQAWWKTPPGPQQHSAKHGRSLFTDIIKVDINTGQVMYTFCMIMIISCVYTRANIVRAKYIPGYFSSDYIRVASTLHYAITLRTLAALTWH